MNDFGNDYKKNMTIEFDYNNMMKEFIGEHGISQLDIQQLDIKNAILFMEEKRKNGKMDWRDLPYNQDDICNEIISYVNEVKHKFEAFVVLGIGGSALGPIAVHQAINHPFYNEISRDKRNGYPKFYVIDNIDPEKLVYLFEIIDIRKTIFNFITKSGSTVETMSQFMIIKNMLQKQLGDNYYENLVCTTDKENGALIKIAKNENYKTFIIPSGVGGRFSEFTPVGLLPAAFCGINIKGLLDGAKHMDNICKNQDIYKNPAYMYAILNYISIKNGKNMCVMMPYADSLKYISDWYAQLWAESIGKKYDNYGNILNAGSTPIKAVGATDQHSQLQLYTEGPFDKIIVFIGVENYKKSISIPKIYEDIVEISFLGGKTQNELIKIEQKATEFALFKAKRPNMTFTLSEVNENSIGQIIYLFEVATAFMGELLNIDAFNQPGVEEIKNTTYAYLGKNGYEQKKKELDEIIKKNNNYIIF